MMARVQDAEFTELTDAQIASTAIGTSPRGVSAYKDLQDAVYRLQPQDTADVQAATDAAQSTADGAQSSADSAQASADAAGTAAGTAQSRADDAYALAGTRVAKDAGPVFTAPTATPSRAALPSYGGGAAAAMYTQADMQAVMDQVAALTSRVAALIVDGRGNHSLTN